MICVIDFETKSTVDLKECGSDVYAAHHSTDVLCLAYAFDDGPIKLWTPKMPPPKDLLDYVSKGGDVVGHNIGGFEILIWNCVMALKYGWPELRIEQCIDTMALAYAMALPGNLNDASLAVGLEVTKDMRGHRVMLQLSQPRDFANGTPVWWEDETKFNELCKYCINDVEVERQLYKRLLKLDPAEKALWILDWKINRRGVEIDVLSAATAAGIVDAEKKNADIQIQKVTNGAVATCTATGQLKSWIESRGIEVPSVAKSDVIELLDKELPDDCRKALLLRQEASKTSTAKLKAMVRGVGAGNRARGLFQYHGASTGRWASRRIQLQNLKRPQIEQTVIDEIFDRLENAQTISDLGSPMSILGDCIRGFIKAKKDHQFLVCDFASIEARVLAWLASEEKILKIFRSHGKIYEHAASNIYQVPIESVTKEQRQIGKVAILALGYGGGVGAFQTMAKAYGVELEDQQADNIKLAWRDAHPKIVGYWYELDQAAMRAVANPNLKCFAGENDRKVIFLKNGSFLWCRLPSGRAICYPYPKLEQVLTPWGDTREALTYMSVDAISHKWERTKTYGGKLSENLTQAVARDILSNAMFSLEEKNYPVVMHVHDEIVCEVHKKSPCTIKDMETIISLPPLWAKDLPLSASGFNCLRYQK